LDPKSAKKLSVAAPIVDMELWGVAWVASQYNLPWTSCKIVSDLAGDSTKCFEVQTKAVVYSEKLYFKYLESKKESTDTISPLFPKPWQPFYATHSQEKLLEKLFTLYARNNESAAHSLKATEILDDSELQLHPKQKTQKYIEYLTRCLDPEKFVLKKKLDQLLANTKSKDIQLKYDKHMDDPTLKVEFNINSEKDLEQKLNGLSEFKSSEYFSCFDGEA